jgi:hypothetical protein
MSYNPQVRGIGEARFTGNDLFFETQEEALAYAADLQDRWMGCERGADNRRAFESEKPVNYRLEKGRGLVAVKAA